MIKYGNLSQNDIIDALTFFPELIAHLTTYTEQTTTYSLELKKGKSISNMAMLKFLKKSLGHSDITVHGFRSSFREWVSEVSTYSAELGESALAHINSNKVEAAYLRSDLLKKRCDMMQSWADYTNGNT